jgi:predicted nucleic acid-binding protein
MAPTAGSGVFLDTNILVYASFSGTVFHAAARARLSEFETNGTILWVSRQVLREFLAVTTRPGTLLSPPETGALLQLVRQFEATFQIADEDAGVTTLLLDLLKSRAIRGKQIHDANIVATMRRYGIPSLLTNNMSDFARYVPDVSLLPLIP